MKEINDSLHVKGRLVVRDLLELPSFTAAQLRAMGAAKDGAAALCLDGCYGGPCLAVCVGGSWNIACAISNPLDDQPVDGFEPLPPAFDAGLPTASAQYEGTGEDGMLPAESGQCDRNG